MFDKLNKFSASLREILKQGDTDGRGSRYWEFSEWEDEVFWDVPFLPGGPSDHVNLGGVNQYALGSERKGGILIAPNVMLGLQYHHNVESQGRIYDASGQGESYRVLDTFPIGDHLEFSQIHREDSIAKPYPILIPPNSNALFGAYMMTPEKFVYVRASRNTATSELLYPDSQPIHYVRQQSGWPNFGVLRDDDDLFSLALVSIHSYGSVGLIPGDRQQDIEAQCREWSVQSPKFVDDIGEDLDIWDPEDDDTIKPPPGQFFGLPVYARIWKRNLVIHKAVAKSVLGVSRIKTSRDYTQAKGWNDLIPIGPDGPEWIRRDYPPYSAVYVDITTAKAQLDVDGVMLVNNFPPRTRTAADG